MVPVRVKVAPAPLKVTLPQVGIAVVVMVEVLTKFNIDPEALIAPAV
jgi:hypothetical protein